jgi:hypothetical protein
MIHETTNVHTKRELTISYQTKQITFIATPFDDVAYWIRMVSFPDIANLPKHIFLHKSSHGWRSSFEEEDFMNELTYAIEHMNHGTKAHQWPGAAPLAKVEG